MHKHHRLITTSFSLALNLATIAPVPADDYASRSLVMAASEMPSGVVVLPAPPVIVNESWDRFLDRPKAENGGG